MVYGVIPSFLSFSPLVSNVVLFSAADRSAVLLSIQSYRRGCTC